MSLISATPSVGAAVAEIAAVAKPAASRTRRVPRTALRVGMGVGSAFLAIKINPDPQARMRVLPQGAASASVASFVADPDCGKDEYGKSKQIHFQSVQAPKNRGGYV